MKKKLLIVLLLIILIATCLTAFVGCEKETVLVSLNYQIIDGFDSFGNPDKGSLLCKPSDPTFDDNTFCDGLGTIFGGWGDFKFPITNPRMTEGFDSNLNYLFIGWYKEKECIRPWVFSEDRVYEETTLYAKWVEKHDN